MTVAYLDILDPEFRPDSLEVSAARDTAWYAQTPLGYAVLQYEPANELISDRRLRQSVLDFWNSQGISDGPMNDFMRQFMPCVDGPDHSRLRRLVGQAFTRSAIDRLRPAMREVTHELIDRFGARGHCDFMADFAEPYSARIICSLLGVPPDQQRSFHGWGDDLSLMMSSVISKHRDKVEAALEGIGNAVDALLTERRARPRPDLLSALIAAEETGDRLSSEELRVMVIGLLLAGQDATQHQLGMAMSMFLKHPEQWVALRNKPELAMSAVEEAMRAAPTASAVVRIASEDFIYRGLTITVGTFVYMLLDAAHNDPSVFGNGDFDIGRCGAAQLTFGGGAHYCLGAALARAEMSEALPILAARLEHPEPDGPAPWRPRIGITGPIALPIRFSSSGR